MNGVLFPGCPRASGGKSSRKNVGPLRALADRLNVLTGDATSAGRKYLAGPEEGARQRQHHHQQRYGDHGQNGNTSPIPVPEPEGGLSVAVVICAKEAQQQIPALQNAAVGTCVIAVIATTFRGQPISVPNQITTRGVTRDSRISPTPFQNLETTCAGEDEIIASNEKSINVGPARGGSCQRSWTSGYRRQKSAARYAQRAARVVIFCKFRGAVVECPLDSPRFELNESDAGTTIGEDIETTDGSHDTQMCWTLPERGFKALRNIEGATLTGISTLAQDMAKDRNCIQDEEASTQRISSFVAEECGKYVVVPTWTGIYIYWTAGSRPNHTETIRITVVGFESVGSTGLQQMVLEDCGSMETPRSRVSTLACRKKSIQAKKQKTRCLALPVTYDTFIHEVTADRSVGGPSNGEAILWKLCRWRWRSYFKASSNAIVPVIAQNPCATHAKKATNAATSHSNSTVNREGTTPRTAAILEQNDSSIPHARHRQASAVSEAGEREFSSKGDASTSPQSTSPGKTHAAASIVLHEEGGRTEQIEGTVPCCGSLRTEKIVEMPSWDGVDSAPRKMTHEWAPTRVIVRVVLANACKSTEGGQSNINPDKSKTLEADGYRGARRTACALLAKAVAPEAYSCRANGAHEVNESSAERVNGLVDLWYEEFWVAASPAVSERPFLSKASCALLAGMLKTPAIRKGFLERGLLRRLVDGLIVSVDENWSNFWNGSSNAVGGSVGDADNLFCMADHDAAVACKQTTGEESRTTGGVKNDTVPSHSCSGRSSAQASTRPGVAGCHRGSSPNDVAPRYTVPWWLFLPTGTALVHEQGDREAVAEDDYGDEVADTDERSCHTASDGGYFPLESGHATSRQGITFGPTNISQNTVSGSPENISEIHGTPVASGEGEEHQSRERATPPMLRLEVLGCGRALQEWSSPPSPRHGAAALTLSAASTRATAHLPTFRSARGATSRASARRHTGRSSGSGPALTGRTTQRSSGCSSPVNPTGPRVSPPPQAIDRESPRELSLPLQNHFENVQASTERGDTTSSTFSFNKVCVDSEQARVRTPRPSVCDEDTPGVSSLGVSTAAGNTSSVDKLSVGVLTDNTKEVILANDAANTEEEQNDAGNGSGDRGGSRPVPLLHLGRLPTSNFAVKPEQLHTETAEDAISDGSCGGAGEIDQEEALLTIQEGDMQLKPRVDTRSHRKGHEMPVSNDGVGIPAVQTLRTRKPVPVRESAGYLRERSGGSEQPAAVLVLSLVCPSTPTFEKGVAVGDTAIRRACSQNVATAELILSLLSADPSWVKNGDVDAALVACLRTFSCAGVLREIYGFLASRSQASGPLISSLAASILGTNDSGSNRDHRQEVRKCENPDIAELPAARRSVEANELRGWDGMDLMLLLRCIRAHRAFRFNSSGQDCSMFNPGRDNGDRGIAFERGSRRHRQWVTTAARVALERAWLMNIIVRWISVAGELDHTLNFKLTKHDVSRLLNFCGATLTIMLISGGEGRPAPVDVYPTTRKSRAFLTNAFNGEHCTLLLAAPAIIKLASVMVSALRYSTAWGYSDAWAAVTLRSTTSSDVVQPGALPTLVNLVDRLTASLVADVERALHEVGEELERNSAGIGGKNPENPGDESHFCRKAPTVRRLAELLSGTPAAVDELLISVLETLQAFLHRGAMLLHTSQNIQSSDNPPVLYRADLGKTKRRRTNDLFSCNVDGCSKESRGHEPDVPYPGPQRKVQREISSKDGDPSALIEQAVSQVLMAVFPLFRPTGCALVFLRAQNSSTQSCSTDAETAPPSVGQTPATPALLASFLRLCIAFFKLWREFEQHCRTCRLEDYVEPLFTGFVRHLASAGATGKTANSEVQKDPLGNPNMRCTGEPPSFPRENSKDSVSLCRLYLAALVILSGTTSAAVQHAMIDLRVPQFLMEHVLSKGHNSPSFHQSLVSRASSQQDRSTTADDFLPESVRERDESVETTTLLPCATTPATDPPKPESTAAASPASAYEAEQIKYPRDTGRTSFVSTSRRGSVHPPNNPPAEDIVSRFRGKLGLRHVDSDGGAKGERWRASGHTSSGLGEDTGYVITVGSRIDGLVVVRHGARPRWFPGCVIGVNEDGTMHVRYDDGDDEKHKDPADVRLEKKRVRGTRTEPGNGKNAKIPSVLPETRRAEHDDTTEQNTASKQMDAKNSLSKSGEQRGSTGNILPGRPSCSCVGFAQNPMQSDRRETIEPVPEVAAVDRSHQKQGNFGSCGTEHNGRPETLFSEGDDPDDMYFVVPSVMIDNRTATAGLTPRIIAPSAVPRIDLQSPLFETTTMRSSQLGPGSSLSTPTTGSRVGRLRGRGGSNSDGAMQTTSTNGLTARSRQPSVVPSRHSSRSPSSPSHRVSILSLSRSASSEGVSSGRRVKRASVLPVVDGDTGSSSGRYGTYPEMGRMTAEIQEVHWRNTQHLHHRQGNNAEPVEESQAANVVADRCSPQKSLTEKTYSFLDENHHFNSGHSTGSSVSGVVSIHKLAVALLLNLVSVAGNASGVRKAGESATIADTWVQEMTEDLEAGDIEFLQNLFNGPENAYLIPGIGTRWRGASESITKAERTAILAKLTCTALFDTKSYNLDGNHIEAGIFGGVIVSQSPLPLHPRFQSDQLTTGDARNGEKSDDGTRVFASGYNHEVALKVVEMNAFDRTVGSNIYREVLALRALSDVTGVCTLYDFGCTSLSYVLVMERCIYSLTKWRLGRVCEGVGDGGIDGAVVGAPGSDREVLIHLLIFRQIAMAATAMAERGVIHCDLKCDNILVRRNADDNFSPDLGAFTGAADRLNVQVPLVCVADFGEAVVGNLEQRTSAIPLPLDDESVPQKNGGGQRFDYRILRARGTERIQSPEMLLWGSNAGAKGSDGGGEMHGKNDEKEAATACSRGWRHVPISTATDVWSLGCLLYELLSAKFLFENLLWSEFFVMLTSDGIHTTCGPREAHEVVESLEGQDADGHCGQGTEGGGKQPPAPAVVNEQLPTVLPSSSMQPFALLGSSKTLRKLLESMLVRNPERRPDASRVVALTEAAIFEVVERLAAEEAADKHAVNDASLPQQHVPAVPKSVPGGQDTCGADDHRLHPLSSGSGGGRIPKIAEGVGANQGLLPGSMSSRAEPSTARTDLVSSIEPSKAVALQRHAAVTKSGDLGCEGFICQLATGAFLLTVVNNHRSVQGVRGCASAKAGRNGGAYNSRSSSQDSGEENGAKEPCRPIWIKPDTLVCTVGQSLMWWPERIEEAMSLRNFVSVLSITHVVCVTTEPKVLSGPQRHGELSQPLPSASVQAMEIEGSKVMHVLLPADWLNTNLAASGCGRRLSAIDIIIFDVVEFLVGSRAVFVGKDGDGGAASAIAMAWSMARTGKSAYETMLDFRQWFSGFWVELSAMQAVIGYR